MQNLLYLIVFLFCVAIIFWLIKWAFILLVVIAQIAAFAVVSKNSLIPKNVNYKKSREHLDLSSSLIMYSFPVALISMTMPWAQAFSYSKSGLAFGFSFLLLLWSYPILMVYLEKPINTVWGVRTTLANFTFSEIFILGAFNYSNDVIEVNAVGAGSVLYFAASMSLLLGVSLYVYGRNGLSLENDMTEEAVKSRRINSEVV